MTEADLGLEQHVPYMLDKARMNKLDVVVAQLDFHHYLSPKTPPLRSYPSESSPKLKKVIL